MRHMTRVQEGEVMQMVVEGCRGLSFLVWLNADRIFSMLTVVAGLLAGAFLGTTLIQP